MSMLVLRVLKTHRSCIIALLDLMEEPTHFFEQAIQASALMFPLEHLDLAIYHSICVEPDFWGIK